MNRKKKIVHLITGLELGGGAENMLLNILPKINKNLHNRVFVIRGMGDIARKLEELGIEVVYLGLKKIFDPRFILRYRNELKKFNPDIQVNYLIHADIFGRIFGKIFGAKKIVSYVRNIHKRRKVLLFLDKVTLFISDFVLTNSEAARTYYIERMGLDANKIRCIPNGIDMSRFKNLKIDRSLKLREMGIPENSLIIGSIARLEKQKDIPTLIKSFAKIIREKPDINLLIVGHGSQRTEIKELIRSLKISNKITLLEKRKDVPELLKIMDIFVLPSLNEGMSNGLLEAMASGKVIITSDIKENIELIRDNVNGFNFKVGDVDDLIMKIKKAMELRSNPFEDNLMKDIQVKYSLNRVANLFYDFLNII